MKRKRISPTEIVALARNLRIRLRTHILNFTDEDIAKLGLGQILSGEYL